MTTEFYVDIKDIRKELVPPELVLSEDVERLEIGACRGNTDRIRSLACLVQEKFGEWPMGTFSDMSNVTIPELRSSNKPFYSKWGKNHSIEFFNTKLRFCWQIPFLSQDNGETFSPEEFQRGMLEFWDSILRDETPIHHSSYYLIDNWGDLKRAIFGDNRYMEPSRFIQGTCLVYSSSRAKD